MAEILRMETASKLEELKRQPGMVGQEVLEEAIKALRICAGCAYCRMEERRRQDGTGCAAPGNRAGRCGLEEHFHVAGRLDHQWVDPRNPVPSG